MENLTFRRNNIPARPLHLRDLLTPFKMLTSLSILLPALLYMTCFGYGTVLFALTGAALFTELYGFNTPQTGLMLSIPLLIGGVVGELGAGWVVDWLSNRYAKKHNGERLLRHGLPLYGVFCSSQSVLSSKASVLNIVSPRAGSVAHSAWEYQTWVSKLQRPPFTSILPM